MALTGRKYIPLPALMAISTPNIKWIAFLPRRNSLLSSMSSTSNVPLCTISQIETKSKTSSAFLPSASAVRSNNTGRQRLPPTWCVRSVTWWTNCHKPRSRISQTGFEIALVIAYDQHMRLMNEDCFQLCNVNEQSENWWRQNFHVCETTGIELPHNRIHNVLRRTFCPSILWWIVVEQRAPNVA